MRRVQNHFPFVALKISSENSYLNLCVANVAKYLLLFPLSKRADFCTHEKKLSLLQDYYLRNNSIFFIIFMCEITAITRVFP